MIEASADASIIQINENSDNTSRDKVITVSLQDNDYLDEGLGVCVSNTFETFDDVKTLVISDESTLEIRALISSVDSSDITSVFTSSKVSKVFDTQTPKPSSR